MPKIQSVDVVAEQRFAANPVAVAPLAHCLGEEPMQQIAAENYLSKTTVFIAAGEGF